MGCKEGPPICWCLRCGLMWCETRAKEEEDERFHFQPTQSRTWLVGKLWGNDRIVKAVEELGVWIAPQRERGVRACHVRERKLPTNR